MPQKAQQFNSGKLELPPLEDLGDDAPQANDLDDGRMSIDAEPSLSMADIYKAANQGGDAPTGELTPAETDAEHPEEGDKPRRRTAREKADDPDPESQEDKPAAASGPTNKELEFKAKEYDELDRALKRSPSSVVKGFFEALSPTEKAEFLKANAASGADSAGPAAAAASVAPGKYEGADVDEANLTDQEKLVHRKADFLEHGEERVKKAFLERDRYLADALYDAAVIRKQLASVSEELGIEFIEPDKASISRSVSGGKTIGAAVDEHYKVVRKAAAPTTPRGASGRPPALPAKPTMQQIMRHIKTHGE